nr:MAG TPA: hypothetical protein [Caudoviricetes sp.]
MPQTLRHETAAEGNPRLCTRRTANPSSTCAGKARETCAKTSSHTGYRIGPVHRLPPFLQSRLMAVKGGSPGNAQRKSSERGAPVRRR